MGLEIERRFLVAGSHWRTQVSWSRLLQQGYLAHQPDGLTLRVRISRPLEGQETPSDQIPSAWLTLKAPSPREQGVTDGLVRQEFEYPIPLEDAEALLALTPLQLHKCRHGLDLPGGDWVVDEFAGANAPLVVAEVELQSAVQHLDPPRWCSEELTGRHEFSNAALAGCPFSTWAPERRGPLLQLLRAEP
ncbi:MAG: CYTH domain-containing protein [Cyanobacteriota bacterium]|nr:CYTH domain-containing protein [Cyanobacteriota bacterium]